MMTPSPVDQQEDEEMLVANSDLVDGTAQPMEVSETEAAVSTVENQQPTEDPPTLKFTWTVPNFSRQNTRKHYPEVFVAGGYKWRILIFPKWNNVDHLSMYYMDVADAASFPYGWSRYSQFISLAVVNQFKSTPDIPLEKEIKFEPCVMCEHLD